MQAAQLTAHAESWPLARPFRIARGVKTTADVVVVEARAGETVGRGECVPYKRYGESSDSVLVQLAALPKMVTRDDLQRLLPPGAARNAADCALWDLESQTSRRSVAELAGVAPPRALDTALTISLDTPHNMAAAAEASAGAALLKVKVDAADPLAAVAAVRRAAPSARLIVDPNESWTPALLREVLPALADLGVALIEQPTPADADDALEGLNPPAPICADEAAHTSADLERVARRYQAVNIKLDKSGGLTEALAMRRRALDMGLQLMIGCMVCTSLSIAPALLLTDNADFVDLDGPWWLARDRESAMQFENGRLIPPTQGWGAAA